MSRKHSLLGLYFITGSYFQGYLGNIDIASVTNIAAGCMPSCCVELLPYPSLPKTKPFGKRLLYSLPLKVGAHAPHIESKLLWDYFSLYTNTTGTLPI